MLTKEFAPTFCKESMYTLNTEKRQFPTFEIKRYMFSPKNSHQQKLISSSFDTCLEESSGLFIVWPVLTRINIYLEVM